MKLVASGCLKTSVGAVVCRVPVVLADNDVPFISQRGRPRAASSRPPSAPLCRASPDQTRSSLADGQAGRMARRLKNVTVLSFHCPSLTDQAPCHSWLPPTIKPNASGHSESKPRSKPRGRSAGRRPNSSSREGHDMPELNLVAPAATTGSLQAPDFKLRCDLP